MHIAIKSKRRMGKTGKATVKQIGRTDSINWKNLVKIKYPTQKHEKDCLKTQKVRLREKGRTESVNGKD